MSLPRSTKFCFAYAPISHDTRSVVSTKPRLVNKLVRCQHSRQLLRFPRTVKRHVVHNLPYVVCVGEGGGFTGGLLNLRVSNDRYQ